MQGAGHARTLRPIQSHLELQATDGTRHCEVVAIAAADKVKHAEG